MEWDLTDFQEEFACLLLCLLASIGLHPAHKCFAQFHLRLAFMGHATWQTFAFLPTVWEAAQIY